MPFPLRVYAMLRKFNQHKLGITLKDVVPNPSTNLILQLDYITNIIDSLLAAENADIDDFEEELNNQ